MPLNVDAETPPSLFAINFKSTLIFSPCQIYIFAAYSDIYSLSLALVHLSTRSRQVLSMLATLLANQSSPFDQESRKKFSFALFTALFHLQ